MSKAGDWVAANAARPRWGDQGQHYTAEVGDGGALCVDHRGGGRFTIPAHEALALANWILEVFK
jgi:hypothetical protein